VYLGGVMLLADVTIFIKSIALEMCRFAGM